MWISRGQRRHLRAAAWRPDLVVRLWLVALAVWRSAETVPALLACAIGSLLVSPISWTHHWVWSAPVIGVLCWQRRWWPAAAATIVFVVSPLWDYPDVWPLRESYVLAGLLLLGLLAQPAHHELDAGDQGRDVVRLDGGEHADT